MSLKLLSIYSFPELANFQSLTQIISIKENKYSEGKPIDLHRQKLCLVKKLKNIFSGA